MIEKGIDVFLDEILKTLASIGTETRELFEPGPPILALISSLAEGSDRIAAISALNKGFALDVMLPCQRFLYESTFSSEDSRSEFANLLAAARGQLILPLAGDAQDAYEDRLIASFEMTGLTMLASCDILLAVWDGKPARGRGGTGEIVDEATRDGLPVAVVDPETGSVRLLWQAGFSREPLARRAEDVKPRSLAPGLEEIVTSLLAPPSSVEEALGLKEYLACTVDPPNALAGDAARASLFLGDPQNRAPMRTTWPGLTGTMSSSTSNRVAAKRYSDALLSAEEIAGRNAQRYRRLFMISSLVTIATSFLVACATRFHDMHEVASAFELAALVMVGLAAYAARRWRWHNQWFEVREIVERLRLACLPWLLGSRPANLRSIQSGWPGWYVRAITRELPLFSGDLSTLMSEIRDVLWTLVDQQRAYHARNEARMERLNRLFEFVGLALFAATLVINVAYLIAGFLHWTSFKELESFVLAASIFLTVSATVAYSVRLFGDYEDLARRSRRTGQSLESIKARISGDLSVPILLAIAELASRAMLSDLETWRVAVESRRLSAT